VLMPMDYFGIYFYLQGGTVHVPRLIRGSLSVEAFLGGAFDPLQIPTGDAFLGSFSPIGHRLPPVFTPVSGGASVFGAVDAQNGVIRVARKGAGTLVCSAGANLGALCTSDANCPGGECALFELRDRLFSGTGPIVIPNTNYTLEAENPVPIEGLLETPVLIAAVRSEALDQADLNADNDQTDPVVTLRSRASGQTIPIGHTSGLGRAETTVFQPPFRFPVLAADGNVVAFLEPEPLECNIASPLACDRSANGIIFETLLRVFRLAGSTATELSAGMDLPVDAAPVLDGRSLQLSNGKLFFRTQEASLGVRGRSLASRSTIGIGDVGNADSGEALANTARIAISPNGRYVAFASEATNLTPPDSNGVSDVFLRDRDTDADGIFDESGQVAISRISVSTSGAQSTGESGTLAMADGTQPSIAFLSADAGLGSGGFTSGGTLNAAIYVRKFSPSTATVRIAAWNQSTGNVQQNGVGISRGNNGRYVVFVTPADFAGVQDGNTLRDAYLVDRDADGDGVLDQTGGGQTSIEVVSFGPSGVGGPVGVPDRLNPVVSDDGRYVAYVHAGNSEVFVRDRCIALGVAVPGCTAGSVRVSVASDDTPANGPSDVGLAMSRDGRFVTFLSSASNLVSGDTNGVADFFVRDRDADGDGIFDKPASTTRVSVGSDGQQQDAFIANREAAPISDDGRLVAMQIGSKVAPTLAAAGTTDIGLHDRLTGLTAIVGSGPSPPILDSGPTRTPALSLRSQRVAFWTRSQLTAQDTNGFVKDVYISEPQGADAIGDGDFADTILQAFDMNTLATAQLGEADRVSVASGNAAILVPESATDWNVDGDLADLVVHFSASAAAPVNLSLAATDLVLSPTWLAVLVPEAGQGNLIRNGDGDQSDRVLAVHPASTAGSWTNVGKAADAIAVSGSLVAFTVPESAQGVDLDGDGDQGDRVLHLYDAATATLINTGRAVDEFVLGDQLVAFRVNEAAQHYTDLNQDGDTADSVLQVYDRSTGQIRTSYQAAVTCFLDVCDPRIPYRVKGRTVTFLTYELEQGGLDLNGDGQTNGLAIQVFNAAALAVTPPPGPVNPGLLLAATKIGVCNTNGVPCAGNAECAGGSCFIPPGACLRDLGTICNIDPAAGAPQCPTQQFCVGTASSIAVGTCYQDEGSCNSNASCNLPATCQDVGQDVQRIPPSLADQSAGEQIFASAGQCLESTGVACTSSDQCRQGDLCDAGFCKRDQGPCRQTADCKVGVCSTRLITAAAADRDGDGIADPFDNCPGLANPDQLDTDTDEVGDACDDQICGNGVREGALTLAGHEECDDSNTASGDGCDASCRLEGAPDCGDGIDNDGDGKIDAGGGPTNDPGCVTPLGSREDPQCANSVDDDFDGQIDWPADTKCTNPSDNDELSDPKTCGLGAEISAALLALKALRRRMRSA